MDAALGIQGHEGRKGIPGRRSVADVASDGGEVAHLHSGEGGGTGGEGRIVLADGRVILQILDGDEGTDPESVGGVEADHVQAGNVQQVDDELGGPKAGTPADQEVGATSYNARPVPVLLEHGVSFLQILGFQVVETGHVATAFLFAR